MFVICRERMLALEKIQACTRFEKILLKTSLWLDDQTDSGSGTRITKEGGIKEAENKTCCSRPE